jgi:hypothetical protein
LRLRSSLSDNGGIEARQRDVGNRGRIAFGDVDGDVYLVLSAIQLDVEGGDASIGKSAIEIEGLNAFEVSFEAAAIEVTLFAPWQLRALLRLQRVREGALWHLLHAVEVQARDDDVPFFAGTRRR